MFCHLISVEELVARYQSPDVVVIDCRFSLSDDTEGERYYAKSHIPGAYYMHLNRDLSGVIGLHGGRHPLPDVDLLIGKLNDFGINRDTLVVAYDDHRLAFASRLWWLLRYLGHDNIKVLNGGFSAWCHAQYETTANQPVQCQTGKMLACLRSDTVVAIESVKTLMSTDKAVLIDSREPERFLAVSEPIDPVAGCIDGAINRPWKDVTDETGFFMHNNYQRQRWGEILYAQEIVVYCGSGVSACVNLLSLAESGRDDAKLYVGSWSDWCSYL